MGAKKKSGKKKKGGEGSCLLTDLQSLQPFGVYLHQAIITPLGVEATVLGVANGQLWLEWPGRIQAPLSIPQSAELDSMPDAALLPTSRQIQKALDNRSQLTHEQKFYGGPGPRSATLLPVPTLPLMKKKKEKEEKSDVACSATLDASASQDDPANFIADTQFPTVCRPAGPSERLNLEQIVEKYKTTQVRGEALEMAARRIDEIATRRHKAFVEPPHLRQLTYSSVGASPTRTSCHVAMPGSGFQYLPMGELAPADPDFDAAMQPIRDAMPGGMPKPVLPVTPYLPNDSYGYHKFPRAPDGMARCNVTASTSAPTLPTYDTISGMSFQASRRSRVPY